MSKTVKITQPVNYRGFILRPHKQGYDLIDPATGKWAHFPTQRFAKWSASFMANIQERFNAKPALDCIPNIKESAHE
jgi:hypothetical protein